MLSFRFCVLGNLSVSFHPSLLRSHSCSASACLAFPFRFFALAFRPSYLLSFVRFFSGFDYSAFRFFFSLCFFSLTVGPKLSSFHNLFRLFPYFRSCFGTQPSLRLRSPLLLSLTAVSTATHPSSFRLPDIPLSFRLRFWILGRVCTLKTEHRYFPAI